MAALTNFDRNPIKYEIRLHNCEFIANWYAKFRKFLPILLICFLILITFGINIKYFFVLSGLFSTSFNVYVIFFLVFTPFHRIIKLNLAITSRRDCCVYIVLNFCKRKNAKYLSLIILILKWQKSKYEKFKFTSFIF